MTFQLTFEIIFNVYMGFIFYMTFDDIKFNRKFFIKIKLLLMVMFPNFLVFISLFRKNRTTIKEFLIEILRIICLYLSYLIITPLLHYPFTIFNDQQKYYLIGIFYLLYICFYNYNYLLNKTELEHNLFNVNTSLIFAYFYYMILISKCNVLDSWMLMFAFNYYFVYQNYTRKILAND